MKFFSEVSKGLAYMTSSIVLIVVLICGINVHFLQNGIFWAVVAPASLPVGLVLEAYYSWMYVPIRRWKFIDGTFYWWSRLFNKERVWKAIREDKVKLSKDDKEIMASISKYQMDDGKRKAFDDFLNENNVARNLWMSLFVCGIAFIFIGSIDHSNTILKSYAEIWLPIVFVLAIGANWRSEFYISKLKFFTFIDKNKTHPIAIEFEKAKKTREAWEKKVLTGEDKPQKGKKSNK